MKAPRESFIVKRRKWVSAILAIIAVSDFFIVAVLHFPRLSEAASFGLISLVGGDAIGVFGLTAYFASFATVGVALAATIKGGHDRALFLSGSRILSLLIISGFAVYVTIVIILLLGGGRI